jgi:DNA-binding NtrC family response regulator
VKGNVLIIDDEAEIRRNLTVGLIQGGFSAVACPDGISAIHELKNSHDKGITYDYLITDIFMPDIDGLKILKVIKEQYPDLPVLVITGYGDVSLELEVISEHNTGYLDKPFEISELVEALKELTPGTTVSTGKHTTGESVIPESVSAYLTIKITDTDNSMNIYKKIGYLNEA